MSRVLKWSLSATLKWAAAEIEWSREHMQVLNIVLVGHGLLL